MDNLPEDVLNIIYRKKHELEFYDVLQSMNWSLQYDDESYSEISELQFTDDIDGQIDRMYHDADYYDLHNVIRRLNEYNNPDYYLDYE